MGQATVFVGDFDVGLQRTLGATLFDVSVDDGVRQHPVIDFRNYPTRLDSGGDIIDTKDFGVIGPSQFGGNVPLYFISGGPPFVDKIRPCILIRRTGMEPAPQNAKMAWGIESRQPGVGATPKTVTFQNGSSVSGFNRYSIKPPAEPYDLSYDIQVYTRGGSAHRVSNMILKALTRTIEYPGFTVNVTDDDGNVRGYDAIPTGQSPSIDILDLTARDAGWTLSIVIHAELDHIEPYDVIALSSTPNTVVGGI